MKSAVIRASQLVTLSIATTLLASCGPANLLEVDTQLSTYSSDMCAATAAQKVTAMSQGETKNFFENSVLQLDPRRWKASDKTLNDETVILAQGTNLTALVRPSCHNFESEMASLFETDLNFRKNENSGEAPQSVQVKLKESISVLALAKNLEKLSCIVGLSEAVSAHAMMTPTDSYYSYQTFYNSIEAPAAWDSFYAADGIRNNVVVAVIDGGIDMTHSDLSAQLWRNTREIPGNNIDDDRNGYVDDVNGYNFSNRVASPQDISPAEIRSSQGQILYRRGHGTHVSGLIAGSLNGQGSVGVANQKVQIMPLNVVGNNAQAEADPTAIYQAIIYAANNGANVINLSMGAPGCNVTLGQAVAYAVSKGVTVVMAVGNSGIDLSSSPISPAIFASQLSGAISVGSTDTQTFARSSFSNYSPAYVEIAAPGSGGNGLLSSDYGNTWTYRSGTSISSPQVAGAAALTYGMLRDRNRSSTPASVEQAILAGSQKVSSLRGYFKDGNVLNLKNLAAYIRTR